jgi:hypothetical protein
MKFCRCISLFLIFSIVPKLGENTIGGLERKSQKMVGKGPVGQRLHQNKGPNAADPSAVQIQ